MKPGFLFLLIFLSACGERDAEKLIVNSTPSDTSVNSIDAGREVDGVAELVPFDPFSDGSFSVGHRNGDFTYTDPFGAPRLITYALWFPTRDETGTPANYLGTVIREEVFSGADPANGEFPLIVFSHGTTSLAEQSFSILEFLASHGFVVLAPSHAGDTFRDQTAGVNFNNAGNRLGDISNAIDAAYNLSDVTLSDEVVMMGHSFGGYTTFAKSGATFNEGGLRGICNSGQGGALCGPRWEQWLEIFAAGSIDSRIDVSIPMAPTGALIFGAGIGEVEIPTLLWTAGMDATLPNAREGDPIWRSMRGDHLRIDLPRAGHQTFSDSCSVFGGQSNGCGPGFVDPTEAHLWISGYSLAFITWHLDHDPTASEVFEDPMPSELNLTRILSTDD